MGIAVVAEDAEKELVVVENEDEGIKNLIIDCEAPIVIIEQPVMKLGPDAGIFYKRLLQMNRELVHGAFVLDETGEMLLFRRITSYNVCYTKLLRPMSRLCGESRRSCRNDFQWPRNCDEY